LESFYVMEISEYGGIAARYQQVVAQIDQAARSADRDPASIKLVVVTKGHPIQAVKEALAVGVRIFGENYVEEGISKMIACSDQTGVEWHMIGHVQSRKAQPVCEHYSWVHSLDRLKLANRLDRFAGQLGRKLPVLLECNVSGEQSKFGWPAWEKQSWEDLAGKITPVLSLPNLDIRGLMTMAPFLTDPEQARPYFQRLRLLRDFLALQFPQANWQELSMGMSADFQVAVQEGATIVRIGTAIMGTRP
jgi:pyridoxal phosphate enzyme (YggS family)